MSNPTFDPRTTNAEPSTKDVAADEAKNVAGTAQQGGQQVADTAKVEAQQLAGEAKGQAQDLFHQVRSEATTQISGQQQRMAGSLRTISGELDQMAHGADTATASGLVSQAAGTVDQVAGWLENREPADVLDEVRRYARRNPGTFLAGAALLGLIGGRLTRGLQADAQRNEAYDARYDTQRRSYGYVETTAPRAGYVETTYPEGTRVGAQDYARDGYGTEVYDQEVTTTTYAPETTTYVEGRGDERPGAGDLRR